MSSRSWSTRRDRHAALGGTRRLGGRARVRGCAPIAGVLDLHRRSGGDLPIVLDGLATTLRERRAAYREVRALTAQARLSGVILGMLPIGFFAFLLVTSRDEMLDAIGTPLGGVSLGVGLVLELLAFVWIRAPARGSLMEPIVAECLAAAAGACMVTVWGSPCPGAARRPRQGHRSTRALLGAVAVVVAVIAPGPKIVTVPLAILLVLAVRRFAERARALRRRAMDAEIPQLLDLLAAGSAAGLSAVAGFNGRYRRSEVRSGPSSRPRSTPSRSAPDGGPSCRRSPSGSRFRIFDERWPC